jgi:formylglycine-generating enzyme required for sulfatase activity
MRKAQIILLLLLGVILLSFNAGPPSRAWARPLAAQASSEPKPWTKEQVRDLVQAGMDSAQLAKKVEQAGIDFDPTEDYLQSLSADGTQEVLIQALRNASPKPLSKQKVLAMAVGGMPGQRAAEMVRRLGLAFGVDNLFLQTLQEAGADDLLIAAVREVGGMMKPLPPAPGTVRLNPKDGLNYAWIPPGTFTMGCSPGDKECKDYESPPHAVTLSKGFWMGQTLVTVAAYKRFSAATGRTMPTAPSFNAAWMISNMPIVNVDWNDSSAYCQWASGRLPTEAEWEYAARGGSTEGRFGNVDDIAWYGQINGGHTHEVAQKRPNGYGLYDMLGNAWEWMNDWYGDQSYKNGLFTDPVGPSTGDKRLLRGASWGAAADSVRVSSRKWNVPTDKQDYIGCRCVWNGD